MKDEREKGMKKPIETAYYDAEGRRMLRLLTFKCGECDREFCIVDDENANWKSVRMWRMDHDCKGKRE